MFKRKKESKCSRFNRKLIYSEEVERFFAYNKDRILDGLAELCHENSGRVSYEDMAKLLGTDYPKAPCFDSEDERQQIIMLLMELKLIFREDETHLYFP